LDQFLKLLAWFEAWRKSSFVCVPGGFPGLQEDSCCAGVILV